METDLLFMECLTLISRHHASQRRDPRDRDRAEEFWLRDELAQRFAMLADALMAGGTVPEPPEDVAHA